MSLDLGVHDVIRYVSAASIFYIYLQALMDSNLPRLQLELYKEIKKVLDKLPVLFLKHQFHPHK